jgi:hypothetical protein
MDDHDHFGPNCPQCRGMAEAAKALGGFAEAWQKMLDDGVFERWGRDMAMAREKAFWDAFLGKGAR